jgi:hypothetical protein
MTLTTPTGVALGRAKGIQPDTGRELEGHHGRLSSPGRRGRRAGAYECDDEPDHQCDGRQRFPGSHRAAGGRGDAPARANCFG